jgi:hypothetical protein
MKARPWVPFAAIALYGIGIFYGRKYFDKRERCHWRYTLAAWNLLLSVFSAVGLLRTLPPIVHNLVHYTWRQNFCMDPESTAGMGSIGLWFQLFCLSKFPYVCVCVCCSLSVSLDIVVRPFKSLSQPCVSLSYTFFITAS